MFFLSVFCATQPIFDVARKVTEFSFASFNSPYNAEFLKYCLQSLT